jgi:hypothetical protein
MILRPVAPAGSAVQPTAASEALSYVDRRFARRKSAATNALIISPDINVPMSCIVRDVSTTGARIELVVSPENLLGGRAKLPGSFTLNMRLDRMEVDCAIVWRNGASVGVRFVSTPRSYLKAGK